MCVVLCYRLKEEVDSVLGSNACVTHEHVSQLKYCSMVLRESLRMYPPTVWVFRETLQDYAADGFLVPKNTSYFVSMLSHNMAAVKA